MPRNRYDEPMHVKSPTKGPTRTKASAAGDVNVNEIIKKHRRTGVVTHWSGKTPMYGDFTQSVDLHSALNLVREAEAAFMELPAEVRKVAKNDPAYFLELLAQEAGTAELVSAGLEVEPRPGDSDYEAAQPPTSGQAPAEPAPSGEAAPEA